MKLQDVDPPDQVSDAFKDVISAQQDKERLINEARGYANDVVPKARGQAAQLLNEAEAYREAKVQRRQRRGAALHRAAGGVREGEGRDAAAALPRDDGAASCRGVNKIIIDDLAGKQTVPYLPLESAPAREAEARPDAPAGGR